MCGIVGYLGPREAIPILIGGLERLEYRGYDSAGVATIGDDSFSVFRSQGKLKNLKKIIEEEAPVEPKGLSIGIGHTRWATHGRPSETNAHPHVAGKVCVVHNGIIENFSLIKQRLEGLGCKIVSETDTEIAAHLINHYLESEGDILSALKKAASELEGSYALVAMNLEEPDRIVLAKDASPAIIGLAEDELFIASDIPAVLEHTRDVVILEDGDFADIKLGALKVENNGEVVDRKVTKITWDPITAEKGGYRHFMLKEIFEQPQTVAETFRGRIKQSESEVYIDGLKLSDDELRQIEQVCIVACGTALHAGLVMKFYIEKLAGIPCMVDYGSEFRYRPPLLNGKTLFIPVSQSGETADTLGSLEAALEQGVKSLAICNAVESSIARKAGSVVYTQAGPEISVASTKAFTGQLTAAYLVALRLGQVRGTLGKEAVAKAIEDLVYLPAHITKALEGDKEIQRIAKRFGKATDFMFLGRGSLYPIALEGALKLKEISYVHAEGYPAGEMKHGPISLITEETPVVVVFGHDSQNYDKALSNLIEVESRGAQIIAVTDYKEPALEPLAKEIIEVGEIAPDLLPIVLSVPLQLLAYHFAVHKGTDIDQPRNLAKSVTVE